MNEHPYALFVFSNANQDHWHFVNVKYDTDVKRRKIFRRIVVGPQERLRTATERITMLDLEAMRKTLFGLDALAIQTAHDNAFDVEAVTEQFFGHYQVVFDQLQRDLRKQTRDAQWAHDFAQQFLNRLMFLYFIQRKRWLGDDPDFICNFWETYKKSGAPKDSFYRDWLAVLFFEAFNHQFQAGRSDRAHLPKKYRDALALAPYLNGGLFAENDLDKKHSVKIGDDVFVTLFDRFDHQAPGFFERYNFTIRCSIEESANELPKDHNTLVTQIHRQFAEEVKQRQTERQHTASLNLAQRYILRELRVLYGQADSEDIREQINLLEEAFRGPLTSAVKREINRMKRNGMIGKPLLKTLGQVYTQHNMREWSRDTALRQGDAMIPRIVCSEALV